MKKAEEYRKHADECRALARGVLGEKKTQLLAMAATWDQLARERSDWVHRHPELALSDEQAEETSHVNRWSNGAVDPA